MFENKEYVYMVYQEKSFSKAAQKMFVTQPCLSAMVKKVEKKLGTPIFNRNAKPIQLTECGEKYIEYITQVMKLEQQFENYLCDIRGLKNGTVSIGANNVCSSFVLPEIMKRFSEQYPKIQIQLHEGNIEYLEEQLQQGALDMILDNYPVDAHMYEIYPVCEEEVLIAVPEDLNKSLDSRCRRKGLSQEDIIQGKHLDGHNKDVSFSDFSTCPFIILRKGNDTRSRFEQLCQEANENPEILLEVDQLSTAYNIVCSGTGVTLVSDTLVKKMPVTNNVTYYRVKSDTLKRQLFFHFPRNRYVSLAMRKFMEEARGFYAPVFFL